MKKQQLLICWLCLCTACIYAQNTITTTFPGPPNGNSSGSFWSRAGNTPINGVNNVFGTLWNSSIYTYTNNSFKKGESKVKLSPFFIPLTYIPML